jgi:hypothetical protein
LESGGVDVFGGFGGLVVGDDGFACFEVNVRNSGAVDVDGVFMADEASETLDVFPLEEYSFLPTVDMHTRYILSPD